MENKEPKQVKLLGGMEKGKQYVVVGKPKQETLEEAAEIWVRNRFTKQICGDKTYSDIYASKESIIESHVLFAKSKQENDIRYTKEDMKSFGDWCRNGLLNTEYGIEKIQEHLDHWEQIKNK